MPETLNPLEAARAAYPDCAVQGCGIAAGGYSRYCHKHREAFYNTRSPTGRILRRGLDLKPYVKMAERYYAKHKDHPAIAAAVAWLGDLLVKSQNNPGDTSSLAKELRRLFRDGATGEAMFLRVAAVAGYAHFQSRTWKDDAVQTCNLGHAALSTTKMPMRDGPNGKRYPTRFSGPTAFALGQSFREVLGVLLAQYWAAIERQVTAKARARESVNKHLVTDPLP
jgi:hypothetical protein